MKPFTTLTLIAVLLAATAAAAHAQDAVRLKNGKIIAGTVLRDEDMTDGFRIRIWQTGGVVRVSWGQVPEAEKIRLTNVKPVAGADILGDFLDGVRILTESREVLGIVTEESETVITVKTAESPQPIPVPVKAVLKREKMRIRESDAYSAQEMVDMRIEKIDTEDGGALLDLADFARGVRLYGVAQEYYAKAKEVDPALSPEIEEKESSLSALIREAEADLALIDIFALADEGKFDEAIGKAGSFLATYADSTAAKNHPNLVEQMEAEKQEFEANKEAYLSKRVGKAWISERRQLLRKYSGRKYSLTDARGAVQKLDEDLMKHLAEKFSVEPSEIEEYWKKADRKKETASYSTGSWIVLGGQDGGYDFDGASTNRQEREAVNDFVRRFGMTERDARRRAQQVKDSRKKLQTSKEWWESVSSSIRSSWLEAFYAENSSMVEVIEKKTSRCGQCRGEGSMRSTRAGESVDTTCPRCHGSKEEVKIYYR